MTNGILKFIKEKDKLYKKLVKANIDGEIEYANLESEFTNYKKILCRSINEAKHLYYTRTFALYQNDIKQTWSVINPIRSGLFQTVNDPGGGFKSPSPPPTISKTIVSIFTISYM